MKIELPVWNDDAWLYVNEEGSWCEQKRPKENEETEKKKRKQSSGLTCVLVFPPGYAYETARLGVSLNAWRALAEVKGMTDVAEAVRQVARKTVAGERPTRLYGISPQQLCSGDLALRIKRTELDEELERRRLDEEKQRALEEARRKGREEREAAERRQEAIESLTKARLFQRLTALTWDQLTPEEQRRVDAEVEWRLRHINDEAADPLASQRYRNS